MRLDFPTLDRPIKAYSGLLSLGHLLTVGELMQNSDFLMSMILPILFAKLVKNRWFKEKVESFL